VSTAHGILRVAVELLRWNDEELFARYAMTEGVVTVDVMMPVWPGLTPEAFFSVLRQLYGSADARFPRLMKLIWGDWREGEAEASRDGLTPPENAYNTGTAGTAGNTPEGQEDLPF
jgi:hypothetical protein